MKSSFPAVIILSDHALMLPIWVATAQWRLNLSLHELIDRKLPSAICKSV